MIDFNGMNTINHHYCTSYEDSLIALGVIPASERKVKAEEEEQK